MRVLSHKEHLNFAKPCTRSGALYTQIATRTMRSRRANCAVSKSDEWPLSPRLIDLISFGIAANMSALWYRQSSATFHSSCSTLLALRICLGEHTLEHHREHLHIEDVMDLRAQDREPKKHTRNTHTKIIREF